jgi:hypothetical protein
MNDLQTIEQKENEELKQVISEFTEFVVNSYNRSSDSSLFEELFEKHPYNGNFMKALIKAGLKVGGRLLKEMIENEDIEFLNFLIQNNAFYIGHSYKLEMFQKVKNKEFSAIAINFYIKKEEDEFKEFQERLRKQYLTN